MTTHDKYTLSLMFNRLVESVEKFADEKVAQGRIREDDADDLTNALDKHMQKIRVVLTNLFAQVEQAKNDNSVEPPDFGTRYEHAICWCASRSCLGQCASQVSRD